ncbi:polysaccharide biosynthesis tyrosine autokinase [Marinobacter nauticus]|uniref:polysaccharide biosynthesis tyrosine autokinase n=1 Tax=Marinobacter nauticus TaxID=2743 RepID=UPI001C99A83A|nr:polysaccharide biosynthesis tyrosine autokinase [Marinobacter nauticus]MBY5937652.1 polysaccharide biosynthesis tyrosine autokinase [Marinobacter nauticus]MBY5954880.1 polysaccharide biosynthesis tyrosine autokinase [Marinobacter nauticus]MBY6008673.1 polysaccharide biosynthesis tyrosine autokinase [Marinobacter nauticus]
MTDNTAPQQLDNDEVDLMALLGNLWDGRWRIAAITVLITAIGVFYALIQVPIYQANALIQIEDNKGVLPGMEDVSELFASESSATTEIEIIKSRRVLGNVVNSLQLDIQVSPNYFPVIGEAMAQRFQGASGELAEPLMGDHYAWGGESLTISRLSVPEGAEGRPLVLEATESGWALYEYEVAPGNLLLEGGVNEPEDANGYGLMVTELIARPGTWFHVKKQRRFSAIADLQENMTASERGRNSGIVAISYEHKNYRLAERILDEVGKHYVRQNVERSSAEASKSLEFLRQKLPEIKQELEEAERKLNEYQVDAVTIDITAEGEAILDQVVDLERRISELEIQRAEIEQRFRDSHPRYRAWASQMQELKDRRAELDQRISNLPETQQRLVRLRRDVEVGNEIYLQMLSNTQQLDIARAGTVGNVRVLDEAAVNINEPVRPKKLMIVAVAFVLGSLGGVAVVLVRAAFNRGVENPDEIERIGLPVYAGIPYSKTQHDLLDRKKRKKGTPNLVNLLAIENPADLAIESLRSLRTSLHFGMMDAKNNILMISGPSPGVGKTFVSTNLAAIMALADQKVLLIDADMRKGFSHEIFKVSNESGLSDVLSGQCSLSEAIHCSDMAGMLSFMPRGSVPPNPSELLMSKRFEELLEKVAPEYDLVIIDTPPILAVTDAAVVGRHAGTTMLVARFGLNPIKEIELTKRRFEQNDIAVKGVILNGVVKKASAYGYGGYGYYNYEYKADKA